VFLVAGTVGGILANSTRPAEFIYDNMMIHATVVHAAHLFPVKRLLYLGSSCIYPREAPQPMKEEHLLSGLLEPTNEPYAVAKIAGIKLCQAYRKQYGCDFISAMPTNLYGPNDNFDLTSAHVLPALIRKFHDAKLEGRGEVPIWGTGAPRREFLHVDDLADACIFLMRRYDAAEHGQRRDRRGPDDPRARRAGARDRAPAGAARVRHEQARRRAAQAARRLAAPWARLAPQDRARRRDRHVLPLVPRESRDRAGRREGRRGLSARGPQRD
jgi:nucleoside-diphosphate-sugar epimerase